MRKTLTATTATALILGAVFVSTSTANAAPVGGKTNDRVVHTPFGSTNRMARVVPAPHSKPNAPKQPIVRPWDVRGIW